MHIMSLYIILHFFVYSCIILISSILCKPRCHGVMGLGLQRPFTQQLISIGIVDKVYAHNPQSHLGLKKPLSPSSWFEKTFMGVDHAVFFENKKPIFIQIRLVWFLFFAAKRLACFCVPFLLFSSLFLLTPLGDLHILCPLGDTYIANSPAKNNLI